MKYDILSAFREYLYGAVKSRKTADRYYFAVDKLLSGCQFDDLSELSCGELERELEKCSGKANFSAAKNGLLHLKEFDGSLSLPSEKFFAEQSRHKRNHSKKPAKTLYLDTTNRKIDAIRDKKLKLAYRLMMTSGLRVNETAQLTKDDILINGENITVNVLHGKGGSNGKVECMQDPYLAKELPLFLEDKPSGEPVFYAQSTMRRRANELGLECHDLRRIAAITYRKEQMDNGTPVFDANAQTKSFLRHARFSTTKRYLFNRKLKYKVPDRNHTGRFEPDSVKMAAQSQDNDWSKTEARKITEKAMLHVTQFAKEQGVKIDDIKSFDGDIDLLKSEINIIGKVCNAYGIKNAVTVSSKVLEDDNDFAITDGYEIVFNSKALRNREITEFNITNSNRFAARALEDIALHEAGHILAKEKGLNGIEIAKKAYYNVTNEYISPNRLRKYIAQEISIYTMDGYEEIIAEILVKHKNKPTDFTSSFIELMKGERQNEST